MFDPNQIMFLSVGINGNIYYKSWAPPPKSSSVFTRTYPFREDIHKKKNELVEPLRGWEGVMNP